MLNSAQVDAEQLVDAGSITDTYLLALAAQRGGYLVSLDRRLAAGGGTGGGGALGLIPS